MDSSEYRDKLLRKKYRKIEDSVGQKIQITSWMRVTEKESMHLDIFGHIAKKKL